jgi:hypothetical protein
MNVRELINELKGCDPDAIICTGGNESINYIECLPSYYDGRLMHVMQDECGNPVKISMRSGGSKVKMHSYDIEDVIFDNPRIEVETGDGFNSSLSTYAEWRQEGLDYERNARKKFYHYGYLEKYDDMLFIWDVVEL